MTELKVTSEVQALNLMNEATFDTLNAEQIVDALPEIVSEE